MVVETENLAVLLPISIMLFVFFSWAIYILSRTSIFHKLEKYKKQEIFDIFENYCFIFFKQYNKESDKRCYSIDIKYWIKLDKMILTKDNNLNCINERLIKVAYYSGIIVYINFTIIFIVTVILVSIK